MRCSRKLLLVIIPAFFACAGSESTTRDLRPAAPATGAILAPSAPKSPKRLVAHGHVRLDEYYGMREREDPAVIGYLTAENDYVEAMMKHTELLQAELRDELENRVLQTDESVPYELDGFWYYTRFEEGGEYPIHCRKRGSTEGDEEVLLDVNAMASGHDGYYSVGRRSISANGKLLAYGVDTVGRRFYSVHFKDLDTGEELDDVLANVTGNLVWTNDNSTVFYTKQDPVTLRSYRIFKHVLGTDAGKDELVYEEADVTFRCGLQKTKSKRYLFIVSSQTLATEYRYLDADDPQGEFRVFLPRSRGHEYRIDHFGEHFYMRTNDRARNFRLVRTPVAEPDRSNWEEIVPHREDVFLQGIEVFKEHLVLSERQEGLVQLRVRRWDGSGEHRLEFGEPAYSARPRDNHEFDTKTLRYSYSSMTTPNSVYDYDMDTRGRELLKRDKVLGGFDPKNYRIQRLHAPAADGASIPISLVYRVDMRKRGGNPLLLSGYGSYGASRDASFSANRVSLLDRGFAYAIAHIRGGQELGREWYEQGKLLNKINTFTDFIACGEYLVAEGFADETRLYAMGGSAGGLLMGAVANMRPDLFHGIVAAVPFVDVVTTMLDDDIPLTTSEFDEWGNPKDPLYYEYMLSYSPYDQVSAQDYPHMLVTTGLHDSQVQYWEPAKWVAKLRATKTDGHRLLLKTNMEAGHGGPSGRFRRYRQTAFQYAFLIDLAGTN